MYVVPTKTTIVEALRSIFNGNYPEADFRKVNVTIDFPLKPSDYPGIWVQFDDGGDLRKAGIDHKEFVLDNIGQPREVTRWLFAGTFMFTVSALSSHERDRLYDELIRVIAFTGIDETQAGSFREFIEDNDLIGINPNYDVLHPSGDGANPGTPWNTNEVIYEKTVSIDMIGEFVSDPGTNQLVNLSRVLVRGYDHDNIIPGELPEVNVDVPYTPGQWI